MKTGSDSDIFIGRRLKKLRRECGMSQLTAARSMGVTQSCISQLENGRRSVSAAAVIRFAELYRVTPSEIYGDPPVLNVPVNGGELLRQLAQSSGSEKLIGAVSCYQALSIYRMLRAVYMLNPHNTSGLFSLSWEEADRLTAAFLRDEPHRLSTLGLAGTARERSRIELPADQSAELRLFIEQCEALLGAGVTGNKP